MHLVNLLIELITIYKMQLSLTKIPLILIAVLFCSCGEYSLKLAPSNSDGESSVSVSKQEICLLADDALVCSPDAGISESVTDTLWINSNRSWSVIIPEVDDEWLSTSVSEYVNVTGEMYSYPLVISGLRNVGSASRTSDLTIYTPGCDPIIVPVVQKAFEPILKLECLNGNQLDYRTDTCHMVVRSNIEWTIEVEVGTSVDVGLTASKGTGVKTIQARFPYNFDDERGRVATVSVNGEGVEKSSVELYQRQSETFFRLGEWNDGIQNPLYPKIHIPLESNSTWSAEIVSTTYANARLVPSSGDATISGFDFIADHGFDPEVHEKSAIVKIHRDGKDDITVSFSQEGCIHLKFLSYNPEYNAKYTDPTASYMPYLPYDWMWVSHDVETFPISAGAREFADQEIDLMMNGGYIFTVFGKTNGVWYRERKEGFQIGKYLNDYIKFPAIEGMRLSRMLFESSALAPTTYTVRTEDGTTIIKGGEKTSTSEYTMIYEEYNDIKEHKFPDTQENTRYRMNLESVGACISIKELCLFYEKVNK